MRITLQYFDGCPNWRTARQRLQEVAAQTSPRPVIDLVEVTSATEADQLGFRGSPTILIDGDDPFADDAPAVGLSCRLYQTPEGPSGSPTIDQLRSAMATADQRSSDG